MPDFAVTSIVRSFVSSLVGTMPARVRCWYVGHLDFLCVTVDGLQRECLACGRRTRRGAHERIQTTSDIWRAFFRSTGTPKP